MTLLIGVIVTAWLCAGILFGAWWGNRVHQQVIDLTERLGPPLGAPGAPEGPGADQHLIGDVDDSRIRNPR